MHNTHTHTHRHLSIYLCTNRPQLKWLSRIKRVYILFFYVLSFKFFRISPECFPIRKKISQVTETDYYQVYLSPYPPPLSKISVYHLSNLFQSKFPSMPCLRFFLSPPPPEFIKMKNPSTLEYDLWPCAAFRNL